MGPHFVGCGEAVGQSFTEPPIPTNPRSSFRHIERIDRATHHRAWEAQPARMVRSAVLLMVLAYFGFGDEDRSTNPTISRAGGKPPAPPLTGRLAPFRF